MPELMLCHVSLEAFLWIFLQPVLSLSYKNKPANSAEPSNTEGPSGHMQHRRLCQQAAVGHHSILYSSSPSILLQ